MTNLRILGATLALTALSTGAAFANTISLGGGVASITCTPDCKAFTGAGSVGFPTGLGTLSSSIGASYDIHPSDASEQLAVNTLTGGSFGVGTKTDAGGAGAKSFDTTAQYILLKIGNGPGGLSRSFVIANFLGGALNISYQQAAGRQGQGGGLSHYSEFAGAEVPVPGAFWIMGAGIAGIAFASGRKKRI